MKRILSWNVNGIRAIQKKGFIDFVKEDNPDILCIQETKAERSQLDETLLEIHGYKSFFNACQIKKGYSGTAIYSKKEPLKIETGFGIPEFDQEGRIQFAFFENFVLSNIYYPNGQSKEERLDYKLRFYDALLDYANKLSLEGKKLILTGDFNTAHYPIDLANPKENENRSGFLPIERKWLSKLVENGYTDLYRNIHPEQKDAYTWWSYRTKARERNIGWRIDYFFANKYALPFVKDAFILNKVLGSDHCPHGILLDL